MQDIISSIKSSQAPRRKVDKKLLSCSVPELWSLCRRPFVLPKNSFGSHICEWEIFDTSYAGCLLCGSIHICNYEDCKRNDTVVETEDAIVCTITGLCLRNLLEDNTFTDTCNHQNNPHLNSNDKIRCVYDDVKTHVNDLLDSKNARLSYELQKKKTDNALLKHLTTSCKSTQSLHLIDIISSAVTETHCLRPFVYNYNSNVRQELIELCIVEVYKAITMLQKHLRITCKGQDLRNTIYGLVYLCRSGVYVRSRKIIQRIPDLELYLPSEANLDNIFHFRAKYITEVENKCKFSLRLLL